MNELEGGANGSGQKHAVITTRWNDFITERLLEGALGALKRHGVAEDEERAPFDFQTVWATPNQADLRKVTGTRSGPRKAKPIMSEGSPAIGVISSRRSSKVFTPISASSFARCEPAQ